MSKVPNIVEGAQASETSEGIELISITRLFDVGGGPDSRLVRALELTPAWGSNHPTVPNLRLMQKTPRAIDTNIVEVALIYRRPREGEDLILLETTGEPEVTAGTLTENTSRDVDGDSMISRYRGEAREFGEDLATFGLINIQTVASVDVQRPQTQLGLSRYYDQFPFDLITRFTGTINANPFADQPARTFLCIGARANRRQGRYLVQWQFAYEPNTWDPIVWVEWQGRRPIDAQLGRGFDRFRLYPAADFAELGVRPP